MAWDEGKYLQKLAEKEHEVDVANVLIGALIERLKEETGRKSITVYQRHLNAAEGSNYLVNEEFDGEGYLYTIQVDDRVYGEG